MSVNGNRTIAGYSLDVFPSLDSRALFPFKQGDISSYTAILKAEQDDGVRHDIQQQRADVGGGRAIPNGFSVKGSSKEAREVFRNANFNLVKKKASLDKKFAEVNEKLDNFIKQYKERSSKAVTPYAKVMYKYLEDHIKEYKRLVKFNYDNQVRHVK